MPEGAPTPAIRPWRDAILAGLAVAAAISLGAYVVYERALVEKVADVRHHFAELARKLSKDTAGQHQYAKKLSPAERAEATKSLTIPLSYMRDNSEEVRRIYTFALEDDEKLTFLDTGRANEEAASRPVPPHARKALDYFRGKGGAKASESWTITDGLEATAFSVMPDRDNKPAGVIGVEADADLLEVKLGAVRQALEFTCLLGLAVGVVAGFVVGRLRIRAAAIQAELEENRQVEEAIVASLGEVIYTFETNPPRFYWRGNVAPLLGTPFTKGEPLAFWLDRLEPEDRIGYEAAREKATVEQTPMQLEYRLCRTDGSIVWVLDRSLPLKTRDGNTRFVGSLIDLTARRAAESQLIESEQRFRDVSEAAGEFIWEVDHENRYIYASRRVVEVLGVPPEEILGRTPFDFVPEEDREDVLRQSAAIQAMGQVFRNFEHRVRRPDGSLRWISVSGVPTFDAEGRIAGSRGASLDISKYREDERELVLQKEAAEAADRAKSNFLAMMSHEIRTPLNSVLGFADLVLDTPLNPSQREHLETIKNSGDALLVILNDILDFSKIESGRMEIEIRPTDLPRCIREVLDLYQLTTSAKRLALELTIDEDVPRYLLTDRSRLRQILVNLVGNAVKFTAEGGIRIHVLTTPSPGGQAPARIQIQVADSGIGITPEQRQRLFRPFTQADSSTTRRFGGSGLGLAISRRLAELLDGELGLLEQDTPGSTFFLDLPALIPTKQELAEWVHEPDLDEPLEAEDETFEGRIPHVLVVDDNTLNRRLTTHLLHNLGAATTTVSSAMECFLKIESSDFDLILMDVQMPTMDGLDATRHLRTLERGRNLPVVALTADAMVGDRERCLEAGMNDYLTKPLRREELARVLREFLSFHSR